MTTNLRLLLDECLPRELAEQIRTFHAVNAEWISEIQQLRARKTTDAAVVAYATEQRRIVVTVEGRFNERKFKICTHPGIIIFKATKHHEAVKAEIFRKFMRSGKRSKAKHAVTYLYLQNFDIVFGAGQRIRGRL